MKPLISLEDSQPPAAFPLRRVAAYLVFGAVLLYAVLAPAPANLL